MADVVEVARSYDEAFNAQDSDARRAIEAQDIETVFPGGMTLRGPDQLSEIAKAFWDALPDGRISSEHEFVAGDTVITEGTLTGTHTGPFRTPQGEVAASGNNVALRYASVKQIRDGRLVAERLYFDQLEFLQQIGAMPAE
jgi:ketosteroid isomerase-like protein